MKQNPPGFLSGYSRGEDVRDLFELTTSNMRLSEMWANQMMFYPAWRFADCFFVRRRKKGKSWRNTENLETARLAPTSLPTLTLLRSCAKEAKGFWGKRLTVLKSKYHQFQKLMEKNH